MDPVKNLTRDIQRVYILEDVQNSAVAQRIRQQFSENQVEIVKESPFQDPGDMLSAEEFDRSKRHLLLKKFEGQFFKQCPGAKPGLVCCNYFVLNLGLQCNMNCSYCYLQSYINSPLMQVYTNIEDSLDELKILADANPDKPYRVGTGETIDSLSLDPLTLYSRDLIRFFRDYPSWTLELKTKSNLVDQFLDCEHAGNVQVAWTLNPQYIIEREEHQTASLDERLTAARKCLDRGFKVAFHMDPMIWHPEWKQNYSDLVKRITTEFQVSEIAHISLGTLRFQPEQAQIMKERFGMDSLVTTAEVFQSRDGKMRFDQRLRKEMFQSVLGWFKEHNSKWKVALCMETPEAWATTMDGSPRKDQNIKELFQPLPSKAPQPRPTP